MYQRVPKPSLLYQLLQSFTIRRMFYCSMFCMYVQVCIVETSLAIGYQRIYKSEATVQSESNGNTYNTIRYDTTILTW